MKYLIGPPKTENGVRKIPMTEEVKSICMRILKNRPKTKKEPIISGYARFLCLDKNEMPKVALHWEKYIQRAREKYNKNNTKNLPEITPHIFRHTYCTNMAKSGMNPKVLQYLMGHSDISVTMDVYTHLGLEDARNEHSRLKFDENMLIHPKENLAKKNAQ